MQTSGKAIVALSDQVTKLRGQAFIMTLGTTVIVEVELDMPLTADGGGHSARVTVPFDHCVIYWLAR